MNHKSLVLAFVVAFSVTLFGCKEEKVITDSKPDETEIQLDVDYHYRPFLHFFTSTGCGGCGRFGIPVFESVANQMGDSIMALPTHFKYNDKFIRASSNAIEKALVVTYHSPQIWVEETEFTYDILNFSIPKAAAYTAAKLRTEFSSNAEAYVGLRYSKKENGRIAVTLAVENGLDQETSFVYEIYSMEDGLVGSQAGGNPFVAKHCRVNRGGYYGGMGKAHVFAAKQKVIEEVEFIPCVECVSDELYFLAIVWQDLGNGRYKYINGRTFKNQ
ncbi:MAG: hypothetical protein ACI8ZN_002704 [Bacteroidia bacterium]|jgi:hypothetical protein